MRETFDVALSDLLTVDEHHACVSYFIVNEGLLLKRDRVRERVGIRERESERRACGCASEFLIL